ncbi:MAG TPA: hypothetical protein VEC35_09470 [Noviherbaspirillum sp.]|nr:hypothetical protein [Noviherbaspirillum sp.]
MRKQQRQSGASLVDLMSAASVAYLMLGLFIWVVGYADFARSANREGQFLAKAAAGLQNYLDARGRQIVVNGTTAGFADPYNPTLAELRAAGFMPPNSLAATPNGGTLVFTVRRGLGNDLLGLVCDNQNIRHRGQPSETKAAYVVAAAGGTGLRTRPANTGTLFGTAFQGGITSPVAGAAIVCAWAAVPNPV